MPVLRHTARLVRVALDGTVSRSRRLRCWCAATRTPSPLPAHWAGGGALVGSEPLASAAARRRPVRAPRSPAGPWRHGDPGRRWAAAGSAISATASARAARARPARRRPGPSALPDFALAFYDHLLRLDATGSGGSRRCGPTTAPPRSTPASGCCATVSAAASASGRCWVGTLPPAPPDARGPPERGGGVPRADRRRRDLPGQPLPAARGGAGRATRSTCSRAPPRALAPRHAALVAGPWGAVVQPLARAVPAPPRPRGRDRADQGHGAARGERRRAEALARRSRARTAPRT